ncbi:MAG: hemerythrin domain-containing protein [Candidatus Eremiobacteraeota bacterium]|nr:hemerythrin domain-containing protein [Candidatus Eremiobacteraeota bacterium]
MDAITLLKADHKKVGGLLKEIDELGDTAHAARAKVFAEVKRELTAHSEVEEKIFYPAFKAKTKKNTEPGDEVLEAYEEHANVKAMLEKIAALDPTDETYNAKLQVMGELVKHHVKEEEGEMFPQAHKLMDESELKDLGEKISAAKDRMLARASS